MLSIANVFLLDKIIIIFRKKNGAHTHVRTTVQLKSAIFTSVVVYSRTSQIVNFSVPLCELFRIKNAGT